MDAFCYKFSGDALLAFINSQFFSSMAGALAGAFAGAMAAHSISTKARIRDELKGQIRATNSAITSSFLISNALLTFKKQHVADMWWTFQAEKQKYSQILNNPASNTTFHFEADLKTIHAPHVPMEVLSRQAYENLSLKGRPLGLVAAIENALASLAESILVRDRVIEQYKHFPPDMDEKKMIDFYFGLPFSRGSVNTEYADSLGGISQYVDDAIFFSSLLCKDLEKYGNDVRDKYLKRYGGEIEIINSVENIPEYAHLMPDQASYESWLRMFSQVPVESKRPWYRRFWK